jgi:hypothetical protein
MESGARGSLLFKQSARRDGSDVQIVQDTGSGGSWPVSTDRVVWSLGARAVLNELEGTERAAFADSALLALRNTIAQDRATIFDDVDGLYRGEQSFLDWREQSYPDFTRDDVVGIAMGKALSTNLLHLAALELARDLAAEQGDVDEAVFAQRATELRTAIRTHFMTDEGFMSSFIPNDLDPAPVRRTDALATSLAILMDVIDVDTARDILSRTPHYGPGVPVLWPQQQDTAIYHNRAEWPFVTAYWLRAAAHVGHDVVATKMVKALVRGAVVHLSNMENFEAGTGAIYVEEGATSGPVVNSRRQLWSVAGAIGMVERTLFGLQATSTGLRVQPFIPAGLFVDDDNTALLGGIPDIVLNNVTHMGKRITVVLHLPTTVGTRGALSVLSRTLNGAPITGDTIANSALRDSNRIDVVLGTASGADLAITLVDDADYQRVFGPRTPAITGIDKVGDRLALRLSRANENAADVSFRVYRDGVVIGDALPGSTSMFTDPTHDATSSRSPCYVVETTFTRTSTHSQHSAPQCFWGPTFERITTINAAEMSHIGGSASDDHGFFHYEPWGDAGDRLDANDVVATATGPHLVQLTFGNGAGGIDTGITCGVKRVVVTDRAGDVVVGDGIVVMPHLGTWARWEDSSFVHTDLVSGHHYRIAIVGDDDTINMSSFQHFAAYTGSQVGTDAFNRVNIAELKLLQR